MKSKDFILFTLISVILFGCTREYDCLNSQIQPAFIGFSLPDIDTFVLKKFKAGDNFQTIIDTFIVKHGYTAQYQISNDTTAVFVTNGENGIRAGNDWQIYLPAVNKSIFISAIISEKKTEKCGSGIFSMDKFGCNCTNNIYSAKKDNQPVIFSNSDTSRHYIFIH